MMSFRIEKTAFSLSSFVAIIFCVSAALATPSTITFQSKIFKPDGKALEASAVSFRLSLTDSVGTCVVYQEDFVNRNMTSSKGLINLSLGGGAKVFPVGPFTLFDAFNNYNNPTVSCLSGGTVNPGANDIRKLVVQFNDGSGWQTVPAMEINANPFAMQAMSAQRLGDYPATDYLRTAVMPTCVGGEALHFNGTSFTCIIVGGGSGTVTSVTSANADIGVATTTTTPVLTLNTGTGANQIVKLTAGSQLPVVSGVNLTNLNASNLSSGTVPAAQMPALTGDVTMTAGATVTAIAAGVVVDADINGSAAIARSKLAAGTLGQVVMNDATTGLPISIGCANNEVIKFNGSGVAVCGTDNAGSGDVLQNGNSFAGTMTLGTNDNNVLNFETNGTTKMTVLANGNVGVGTANPTEKLHIEGTANQMVLVKSTGVGNHSILSLSAGAGGIAEITSAMAGSSTYFTNSASDYIMRIDTVNKGVSIGSGAGYSDPGSSSPANGLIVKGNVGIGTTSPQAKLQIQEADGLPTDLSIISYDNFVNHPGTRLFLRAADGTSSAPVYPSDENHIGDLIFTNHLDTTGGAGLYGKVPTGQDHSAINSPMDLYFATTPIGSTARANRMMINSAGNVGIGTTSPQRLLHTAGPIRIAPTAVPGSPAAGDIYVDSADSNKLKVYDGSGWVAAGGGGSGTVTSVTSVNADIGVATTTTTPVLTLNTGTGNNQIVKLNGSAELPAVSGVNLTFLNATNLASGSLPAARFPAFTGDVTTSAGAVATTIAANAVTSAKILDDEIVNADINSAAAIARTKLASGSNSHVLINDGSGVMSSEAQLAVARGGTGVGSFAANQIVGTNGTGSALSSFTCSLNQVIKFDVTGNAVCGTDNTAGSASLSSLAAATTTPSSLDNGTNLLTWNWALTSVSDDAFTFGETTASSGGTGDQSILKTSTLASSTAVPLMVTNLGNGLSFRVNDQTGDTDTTPFVIDASGKVGVYTKSPSQDISIGGGNGGGSRTIGVDRSTDTGTDLVISAGGAKSSQVDKIGGNLYLSSGISTGNQGSDIYLQTANPGNSDSSDRNPTTKLTIKGSGNVGVGTTSPSSKLTVSESVVNTYNPSAAMSAFPPGAQVLISNSNITDDTTSHLRLSVKNGSMTGYFGAVAATGGNPYSATLVFGQQTDIGEHAERMRIDNNGNVGIGVTGPTSILQVAGDITPDTTATKNLGSGSLRWNNIYLSNAPDVSSDARLKKDVKTSDLGLDFINSLRPVSWTWKDQSRGTTQHYGVIAQEAESAIAKAKGEDSKNVIVTHNLETDSYSVRYTELISPLIKAIQEIYSDLLGVKAVINTQERQIANIEVSKADQAALNAANAKIQKLEAENAAMRAYLCSKDSKATICK
jgi:trimeric autotransporter adhesin